jgi:hypothetical protein
MSEEVSVVKSVAATVENISDIVNKLAGPLSEEVGMLFGDKVRVYRVKNWIRTTLKTERLLREAGLSPNAVPPRLFLPIMEASSVEENELLQDMWAGLLATASQETDDISPSFIETMKQLTPNEARFLQGLYEDSLREMNETMLSRFQKRTLAKYPISARIFLRPPGEPRKPWASSEPYERLGLVRREYDVKTKLLDGEAISDAEIVWRFFFTEYGIGFMRSCRGPRAKNSQGGTAASKSD